MECVLYGLYVCACAGVRARNAETYVRIWYISLSNYHAIVCTQWTNKSIKT